MYALGEHPFKKIRTPNVGIIVTAKSFKDGIQDEIVPKLLSVVGSKDIVSMKKNPQGIPTTIRWRSGSVTYLMSAEQDDVAFESKTIDHVWIDEPVRRNIFVALKRGMLTTGGHVWFTCTPLDEPWLYDEIYMRADKDPRIEVFEGCSDENTKISQKDKDDFLSVLTEDEIETRWFGKFKHLAGRVFKAYKPEIHLVPSFDIPSHWPVWSAIDPHTNKPHAVMFMAVDPHDNFYVCNEIFTACEMRELAGHIKDVQEPYNLQERLIDTSAQGKDWKQKSAREMLEDYGLSTKLAQKKNLKKSGIILINQLFKQNKLFIMQHCHRTHRELTLQVYKRNKRDEQNVLEEPEKKFDDMTDALRYILVERPSYQGTAQVHQVAMVDLGG